MKKLVAVLAATTVVACVFSTAAMAGYVNKDVHNLSKDSQAAHDLKVVIQGHHRITWNFKGYPDQWHFNNFRFWTEADKTVLKWWNPRDGNNDPAPIPWCQRVHVGWDFRGTGDVVNMYWTDEEQMPLIGSVVWNVTAGKVYQWPQYKVEFTNYIEPNAGIPMQSATLTDVRYAVLDSPVPADELNGQNLWLQSQLQTLDPGPITIAPDSTVEVMLPVDVDRRQYVVIRYNNNAPGTPGVADSTDAVDFWQWRAVEANVPTVNRWGLVVLGLALVCSVGWLILRRKRVSPVGARMS